MQIAQAKELARIHISDALDMDDDGDALTAKAIETLIACAKQSTPPAISMQQAQQPPLPARPRRPRR
jgi:hypothetical protein